MTPADLQGKRQAVILIHGIGEQRPMETLRAFISRLLRTEEYVSKPDHFSNSFELRRLMTKESAPRTDFFELYWQHKITDSKLQHVGTWLWTLLKRRPHTVPDHLLPLWLCVWILTVTALGFLLWAALLWLSPSPAAPGATARNPAQIPLLISLVLALVQGLLLAYIGDAARYLSAAPSNIECRQAIREAGVRLLIHLHASGNYSRIAIVGHSLGSIIGYDILTYAWQHFHNVFESPPRLERRHPDTGIDVAALFARQQYPDASETWGGEIEHVIADVPSLRVDRQPVLREMEAAIAAADICAFRQLQRKLWIECRQMGMPWLVTDFVTVGSPLAHAALLMARDKADLKTKQAQRELITCPPVHDPVEGISFPTRCGTTPLRAIHHAGCFAVTRWTNLYFTSWCVFYGDFLSGRLRSLFGKGVEDLRVKTSIRRGWFSHTSYWDVRDRMRNTVKALRKGLDLECETFDSLPYPPNLQDPIELSPMAGAEIHFIR
jgi:hypothetical protein